MGDAEGVNAELPPIGQVLPENATYSAVEAEEIGEPVEPAIRVVSDDTRGRVATVDPEAIITEYDLVRLACPSAIPICTDQFMNLSKDSYPLPWLVREIVQNFVDGNKDHPHTLDGVDIQENGAEIPNPNSRTFTMEGNWVFKDPTGLIALHSGKAKSKEGESRNAGGNGIGLKQTALRFLRDYGVKRFEVKGEGWCVEYKLMRADELNNRLRAQGMALTSEIENDWLVGSVERSDNKGKCSYEIEVEDTEATSALREMQNIGASSNNEYLKDPDYENKYGSFKWIFPSEKNGKGRLFINGQVMNFKARGETTETYWDGPENVSINLKNLDYDMSLDRPPVSVSSLRSYVYDMMDLMTKEDLVEQLKRSEAIWSTIKDPGEYASDRPACLVLVNSILSKLRYHKGFGINDFIDIFGAKYLALDRDNVTEEQARGLEEKGWKFCPEFFEEIGVPKASSRISAFDLADREKPKPGETNLSYQATSSGIPVGYRLLRQRVVKVFLKQFKEEIGDVKVDLVDKEKGNFRMYFGLGMRPKDHVKQMIVGPTDEKQEKIYSLRGFIAYGLKGGIFKDVIWSEGDFFMTFALQPDGELFMKIVDKAVPAGLYVTVDEKAMKDFMKVFVHEDAEGKDVVGYEKKAETTDAGKQEGGEETVEAKTGGEA